MIVQFAVKREYILLAVVLFVVAVVGRLIPHPPNVAPVTAIALFGGAVLSPRLRVVVPLAAMVASDLIIGTHSLSWVVWFTFTAIALYGGYVLRGRMQSMVVVGSSLLASLFFFIVTNFAVWAEGRLYERTWGGLIECYVMAIPFLRNTLIGDVMYAGLLFGAYYAASHMTQERSTRHIGERAV